MRAPEKTFVRARRLRGELSLPEVILWDCLRAGRLDGFRIRRQHPIGPFVLDFFCSAAQTCIEVDGAHHNVAEGIEADARRDAWLAARGIAVLRIAATDILDPQSFDGVLIAISAFLADHATGKAKAPPPPPPAVPLPRERGRISVAAGCDLDPPLRSGGGGPRSGGGGILSVRVEDAEAIQAPQSYASIADARTVIEALP